MTNASGTDFTQVLSPFHKTLFQLVTYFLQCPAQIFLSQSLLSQPQPKAIYPVISPLPFEPSASTLIVISLSCPIKAKELNQITLHAHSKSFHVKNKLHIW